MRFFFDRNMSPYLARTVAALDRDNNILHHDWDQRFNKRTTDIEWLTALAKDEPRWIVLSGDSSILRNKTEQLALRESKLTFFCLSKVWTHMQIWEFSWRFIKIWPDIVETASRASSRPQIHEVAGGKSNKIELIKM